MSANTELKTKDNDSALLKSREQQTTSEWLQGWISRARSGDLGQLPVLFGLLVICIVFQIANPIFLSPGNLVTLLVQAVTVITLAFGVVIILLLGEIDLSMGYTAGISAVVIALLLRAPIVIPGITPEGGLAIPWWLAIAVALGITVFIGFLQGFFVTYFKLPSFIVTLAGQLALSGVVLLTVKGLGTLSMRDATVLGTVRAFLPLEWGVVFSIIVVAVYFLVEFQGASDRRNSGLNAKPLGIIMAQTAVVAGLMLLLMYVAYQARGIPLAFVLVLIMMVTLSYITTRTKFGRYLFAVGGNKEAARRAGIAVERIRIYGFMLGSLMAGAAGIFLLARLASVATDTGGGPLLLNGIAAAVIGGTSLFGGSGKVSSALLGGLVISVVDNGLGLIPNIPADAKFILTAAILLLAVIVDSFTRRNATKSGR
jgi:D-xylose transport system permease protein